jgi:hypothetical protein
MTESLCPLQIRRRKARQAATLRRRKETPVTGRGDGNKQHGGAYGMTGMWENIPRQQTQDVPAGSAPDAQQFGYKRP